MSYDRVTRVFFFALLLFFPVAEIPGVETVRNSGPQSRHFLLLTLSNPLRHLIPSKV